VPFFDRLQDICDGVAVRSCAEITFAADGDADGARSAGCRIALSDHNRVDFHLFAALDFAR